MVQLTKLSKACVFLFSSKSQRYFIKQLVELCLRIAVRAIYTRHILLLKIFWNFSNFGQKQPFWGVLVYMKTPVLESFFNKVSSYKKTQVFSSEFWEAFRNTFFSKHLLWRWSLSLKKFYIVGVGVRKKVFE